MEENFACTILTTSSYTTNIIVFQIKSILIVLAKNFYKFSEITVKTLKIIRPST
jgi:hypothetical protein